MHTSDKTKAFEGIFVSILVIAIFATSIAIFSLADRDVDLTVRSYTSFRSLGVRPDEDALTFDEIPTDANDLKQFAYELYMLGGTNAKTAAALAAYCTCQMKMDVMNILNYVDIDASIIKTQDEFFRIDYRLERDLPFKEKLGVLADSLDMVLTERFYTNTDMDYLAYQKVQNSHIDENDSPSADWSAISKEEQREVPVYNSTQDGIFEVIAYTLSADAISTVSIEYVGSENGNYYSVKLVCDPSNTALTERVIGSIREGSMDDNAYYSKIEYDFELWDNGYFKSIRVGERWDAQAMGMKFLGFSTESVYNWSFSYDEADASPDGYKDCAAAKEAILG